MSVDNSQKSNLLGNVPNRGKGSWFAGQINATEGTEWSHEEEKDPFAGSNHYIMNDRDSNVFGNRGECTGRRLDIDISKENHQRYHTPMYMYFRA